MNLEQIQKQLEDIQKLDMSALSPEKLSEVLAQLSSLVDESEQSLINTTLIEINKPETKNENN